MAERPTWRLLDTGLRGAAENMALDQVLLESHQEGHSPNTLRFLRFEPCVLVGYHQKVAHEVWEDFCAEHGIAVNRRITGGGTIYFDPLHLGWELYFDRAFLGTGDMAALSERICRAAAGGLQRLGVDAHFRPRNDIEVNGRKISGTGGAFDGSSVVFQGTVLIDAELEKMLGALRVAPEKLSKRQIADIGERLTTVKEVLGGREVPWPEVKQSLADGFAEELGIDLEPGDLNAVEQDKLPETLAEMEDEEWIHLHAPMGDEDATVVEATHRSEGGLVRAAVAVEADRGMIKHVTFSGDFFVNPKRMVFDLESTLRNLPMVRLEEAVRDFFRRSEVEMLLLGPEDFLKPVQNALAELRPSGQGEATP
ncbi:lipoyl protein ligase domain-containing protein [Thiohalorhabdus methylotrophus]|uniref:Lipoate--protein ligase family protein n=1 Tax=Thiohalorhabdus methylotrophus TaxID=3242694 RepID=A0ABV4TRC4_9GAMM